MNKVFVEAIREDLEYQPLLVGSPQTSGMRAGKVFLQPGKDCGQHSTENNEEILIFLSGNGQAVMGNGQKLAVGQGKVIYIPPNTVHNIINNSDKPLCYIFCVAPINGKGA